jgi:hypothetical protein
MLPGRSSRFHGESSPSGSVYHISQADPSDRARRFSGHLGAGGGAARYLRGILEFVLIARYPLNPENPTRRALGDFGEITLYQAREKAREWLAVIDRGIDPKTLEARERANEIRQQINTFANVAEASSGRHVNKLRRRRTAGT